MENDGFWDHSVIIVRTETVGPNNLYHWIAGHTPDTYDYPFTDFIYDHPDMIYRFTHIDGIDGYAMNYVSLVMNNSGGFASQMMVPNLNPYPGPMETNEIPQIGPYPPP